MKAADKVAAFHVGIHKTGTSTLQTYCFRHYEELLHNRLLVLDRNEMRDYTGWGATVAEKPQAMMARIKQLRTSDGYDALFGSSENLLGKMFERRLPGLYPNAAANLSALARAIRHCRGRVIISIRPQHALLESYYLQTIHQGGFETFPRFLDRIDLDQLSFRPIIDAAHEAFGSENTVVIDFRTIKEGEDKYVQRFFAAVSPQFDVPVSVRHSKNRSISRKGLALALAINPNITSNTQREASRRFLQRYFSNVDYPRPVLLTPEQMGWLNDRYSAEYDEIVGRRVLA